MAVMITKSNGPPLQERNFVRTCDSCEAEVAWNYTDGTNSMGDTFVKCPQCGDRVSASVRNYDSPKKIPSRAAIVYNGVIAVLVGAFAIVAWTAGGAATFVGYVMGAASLFLVGDTILAAYRHWNTESKHEPD